MSRIEVRIDRIVLSGIDAGSRDALVAGVRDGLTRALSTPAAHTAHPGAVLRIGGLTVEPGRAGARKLGRNIGQAIGRAAR